MFFVDGTPYEGVTLVLNGQRTPISRIAREQLPTAHAEYLRSVPELKPGVSGAPPFDRLPAELQTVRQWAFEKLVKEMGWLPNTLAAAESWRQEFTALRRQRLEKARPLGSVPLVVLERGNDSSESWHMQQLQLAGLSTNGKWIRAENSGHAIHLERPDLLARSILDVVVGASKHQPKTSRSH